MLPLSDHPGRFERGARLAHDDGRTLVVAASRPHKGDRLLVKFEGIDSRDEAAELRGSLYVLPGEARELEPDEYWPRDLVGCEVLDQDGRLRGRVTAFVPSVAQDLLEVATPGGPALVPLAKAIVTGVDLQARRITVDPPPGLLER